MELRVTKSELKELYNEAQSANELWVLAKERGFVFETEESEGEIAVFARIYLAYRRRLHHKGLVMPRKGSQQWLLMEKITEDAIGFCKEFDLDIREGFHEYLKIANTFKGLKLRVLQYKSETIARTYEAFIEITEGENKELVKEIMDCYAEQSVRVSGIVPETKGYLDQLNYVKAAKLVLKYNIQPREFIEILTDKWAWTQDILQPKQLHGDKAEEYLQGNNGHHKSPLKVKKVTLPKGPDRY